MSDLHIVYGFITEEGIVYEIETEYESGTRTYGVQYGRTPAEAIALRATWLSVEHPEEPVAAIRILGECKEFS